MHVFLQNNLGQLTSKFLCFRPTLQLSRQATETKILLLPPCLLLFAGCQPPKLQFLLQKTFSKGEMTLKIPGLLTKHSRKRKEDRQILLKLREKNILIIGCQETEKDSPCLMSTLWSRSAAWAPFLYSQRQLGTCRGCQPILRMTYKTKNESVCKGTSLSL